MTIPLPFPLALRTERFGHPLHFWGEVDSTNRLLGELAADGAPEGTVVLADFQRGGRGRQGREWRTPPGSSLLLSVLLRPTVRLERVALLPLVVGVAVAHALETHLGLQPTLKWPNDLLLAGRKGCGILLESTIEGERPRVIVGIGLNVNQTEDDLAALPDATSLRLVLGSPVERGALLAALLEALEQRYDAFQAGWQPHDAWRRRAALLGQPIMVHSGPGHAWPATALELASDGSLLVQDQAGQLHHLHAAEVSVRAQLSKRGNPQERR